MTRKERFVELVEQTTQAELERLPKKHAACVAPGLGPVALARLWREDRLPEPPALDELARRLVVWALGLDPEAQRPYTSDDIER